MGHGGAKHSGGGRPTCWGCGKEYIRVRFCMACLDKKDKDKELPMSEELLGLLIEEASQHVPYWSDQELRDYQRINMEYTEELRRVAKSKLIVHHQIFDIEEIFNLFRRK